MGQTVEIQKIFASSDLISPVLLSLSQYSRLCLYLVTFINPRMLSYLVISIKSSTN